jgi:hypothetical protein
MVESANVLRNSTERRWHPRHAGSVAGLAVVVALLMPADPARANGVPNVPSKRDMNLGVLSLSAWTVFGIADTYYLGRQRVLPPGWAATQVVVGGALSAAVMVRASEVRNGGPGMIMGSIGLLFASYGAISLALYEWPPREPAPADGSPPPRARAGPRLRLAVAPLARGREVALRLTL